MYHFSAVPYLRMNSLLLAFTQRYALGCAVNRPWAPSLSDSVALRDRERESQDWTVGMNIPLSLLCLTWHLRALCYT